MKNLLFANKKPAKVPAASGTPPAPANLIPPWDDSPSPTKAYTKAEKLAAFLEARPGIAKYYGYESGPPENADSAITDLLKRALANLQEKRGEYDAICTIAYSESSDPDARIKALDLYPTAKARLGSAQATFNAIKNALT